MIDDDLIFAFVLGRQPARHGLLIMFAYFQPHLVERAEATFGLRSSSVLGPFEAQLRSLGWQGPEPPGHLDRER
jgi:hypothetical protein